MKGKYLLILSVLLIVGGAVLGYFAKYDVTSFTAFAMTMFGAGLAVAQLWNNKKEDAKRPLVILSMVFVGVGAFIAGLTGAISKEQITSIIGYVFALAMLIAGIITVAIANNSQKKLN